MTGMATSGVLGGSERGKDGDGWRCPWRRSCGWRASLSSWDGEYVLVFFQACLFLENEEWERLRFTVTAPDEIG
jgi:hypothetical protein